MDNINATLEIANGRVSLTLSAAEDDLWALEACLTPDTVDEVVGAIKARLASG